MTGLPEESTARVVDSSVSARYAEWVAALGEPADLDPYYSVPRCRFALRDDDILHSLGDAMVRSADCGAAIVSERARVRMDVCGVNQADAAALVAAADGTRTFAEVRSAAGTDDRIGRKFLIDVFGTVVLAPHAVSELDRRVSAAEVTRYPGSPYEIVRAYWENMADVAERLNALESELETLPRFLRFLRELNVIALVGSSGRSFYLPASPAASRGRVQPGEFWSAASVVEPASGGVMRFVSGPRVNASPIGGAAHQGLLSASLGDPDAAAPARVFTGADGLDWGRLVLARADGDERAARWFCPPRPIDTRHVESLRVSLLSARAAVDRSDRDIVLHELAAFHQRFVRLHPFRVANQCVAMSVVNHVLRQLDGVGIPHLVLDHFALQLSTEPYARAFALAVGGWLVTDSTPVERHWELVARKVRCFDFLKQLSDAPGGGAALALVHERPDDARLASIDPVRLSAQQ